MLIAAPSALDIIAFSVAATEFFANAAVNFFTLFIANAAPFDIAPNPNAIGPNEATNNPDITINFLVLGDNFPNSSVHFVKLFTIGVTAGSNSFPKVIPNTFKPDWNFLTFARGCFVHCLCQLMCVSIGIFSFVCKIS